MIINLFLPPVDKLLMHKLDNHKGIVESLVAELILQSIEFGKT